MLVIIFNAVSFCIRLNQTFVNDLLIAKNFSTIIPLRKSHLVYFWDEFDRIEVNSTNFEGKFVELLRGLLLEKLRS